MKNFSLKTKGSYHRNSNHKVRTVLISIGVALIVLYFFGGSLGVVGSAVSRPFFEVRNWVGDLFSPVGSYFRSREELEAQNAELRQQIERFAGAASEISRLGTQNEEYQALLGTEEEHRIVAGVIARPPFVPYDTIFIDRGADDGVVEGAVVFHAENHVLGLVAKTYTKTAMVVLASTPGVETTAYVIGPNIYTTARGEGGGVIRIGVPQGIPVSEGNTVIIPSVASGILGEIREVRSNPSQPEQHAFVLSPVSLQELYLVEVSTRALTPATFEEAQQHVQAWKDDMLKVDVPEDLLIELGTSTATTTAPSTATTTDSANPPE